MDVTKIPFNQFIGLKKSDKSGYLLMLDNRPEYRNHLDTVHASAQFALAEASSGYFLLNEFSEMTDIVPVVRKVETKYRKPASDILFSKAQLLETNKNEALNTLNEKGRTSLKVEVSLHDEADVLVMQSVFEWFITKISEKAKESSQSADKQIIDHFVDINKMVELGSDAQHNSKKKK